MTTFVRETEVTRPVPDRLTSSVLDHATVVDVEHFGLRNEAGLWPSYNCLDLLVPTPVCPDPSVDKTFDVAPWVPAFTFAVQGGVECALVGLDRADQAAEVQRVFERSEGKGVERALLANRFVANDPDTGVKSMTGVALEWDDPIDVTPAGKTISIKVALALLEGYAAAHYAGVPTIHAPRAAVSLMSDMVKWIDGKAYTPAGSKLAIGGGYDESGEVPDDGKWDLYATGEVYVERAEQIDVSTYELNGGGDTPFDPNTGIAFVERMYRVGVDCFVAKATGTIWS